MRRDREAAMTALASAQQTHEGGPLRTFLAAPLRARTWRELLHLLLDFPIGVAGFCFVGIFLTGGLFLAVTIVGLPLLAATLLRPGSSGGSPPRTAGSPSACWRP
jgi:hypothetical protein